MPVPITAGLEISCIYLAYIYLFINALQVLVYFAIGEAPSGNVSNVNTVFCLIHSKGVLLNKYYGQLGKPLKVNPKFPKSLTIHILISGRSLPKGKEQERKKSTAR